MHYRALLILPADHPGELSEAIETALAPYDESLEIELSPIDPDYPDEERYMHNPRAFWDWWQIGGRHTGYLSGYEPALDPDNIETCTLCDGSGTRPDGLNGPGGCNACNGIGSCVAWPTAWKDHPGDVQHWVDVRDAILSGEKTFFTVIAGEQVAHKERYVPDAPQGERFQPTEDIPTLLQSIPVDLNAICVVIDYHS